MSHSLDGASVNENHEIYMKDYWYWPVRHNKRHLSDQSITTVTPEKKAEEERDEEEEKRRKGEEVTPISAIRHEGKELEKTQDDLMKHQTNISELKRTFLETSTDTAVANEWEKRLSTSPMRLAARQEDAPMIEPLVPEESQKMETKTESSGIEMEPTSHHLPLSTE
ncbi:hypothetical protein P7K49_024889 [Saguinus oedipus]|uniref:SAB domain-containing protein n=1 Tax=Saguinus oedipus TaxID=9490 RepID=A0ABQ9UFP6_SAGOE|nr:hypothetical protein P7K49_024889 [Saguinus oedipus]